MRMKPRFEKRESAPVTEKNFRLAWWSTYRQADRCTQVIVDKNGITRQCAHDKAPGLQVCRIHKRRR